ncbi:MAG TPA: hypothetical protein VEP49_17640 [Acidimicrobiia bacterium]|nr:hypothetical protein [Acidimicrobiia bacterium]
MIDGRVVVAVAGDRHGDPEPQESIEPAVLHVACESGVPVPVVWRESTGCGVRRVAPTR